MYYLYEKIKGIVMKRTKIASSDFENVQASIEANKLMGRVSENKSEKLKKWGAMIWIVSLILIAILALTNKKAIVQVEPAVINSIEVDFYDHSRVSVRMDYNGLHNNVTQRTYPANWEKTVVVTKHIFDNISKITKECKTDLSLTSSKSGADIYRAIIKSDSNEVDLQFNRVKGSGNTMLLKRMVTNGKLSEKIYACGSINLKADLEWQMRLVNSLYSR
jgi:hypothetical protein